MRRSCPLIPSAWPWTHTVDPIESPPFLRSNLRWRTYHRARRTLLQLPSSLLVRLSQQAVQILTDESSFFCNLFHERKRSYHGSKATGRSQSWDGDRERVFNGRSNILVLPDRSIGQLRPPLVLRR